MVEKTTSKSLSWYVFAAAIVCVQIDGFPYFPTESDHRPLSNLIVPLYLLITKFEGKIHRYEKYLLTIFCILWVFTLYKAFFVYGDYGGLIKFTVTGILAITTIISCYTFLNKELVRSNFDFEVLMRSITSLLVISTILPIFFGLVQLLAIIGVVPLSFSEGLSLSLIYRFNSFDRLQFLNQEPFSASMYFIVVLLFYYFFAAKSFLKPSLVLLYILCVMLTSSTAGFASLTLTLGISQLFFFTKKELKSFALKIPFIVVSFYFIIELLYMFAGSYTLNKFSTLASLFNGNLSYADILAVDFSIADRTFSPIIPFFSFSQTYGLGAGGESFKYIYSNVVYTHFPDLANNEFIRELLLSNELTTPKILFSKLVGDFGLVGGGLFLYFIYYIISSLVEIKNRNFNSQMPKSMIVIFVFSIFNTQLCSYYNFTNIFLFTLATVFVSLNKKMVLHQK